MNRAGSVDQKPLYGCTNCAEDYSWPAVDLAVYQGECWCENCWDELRWDGDLPDWSDLDDFVPEHEIQLAAERADAERYRWWVKHGWFYRGPRCLQETGALRGEIGVGEGQTKKQAIDAAVDAAATSAGGSGAMSREQAAAMSEG